MTCAAESWRHGLLRGEHADEDQPALTVRTDPRLDWRRRLYGGWYERWSGRVVLYQVGLRRRQQLHHLPYPGGVPALRGMPQAEVTDFVEASWQHMLEEAAHELVAAETTGTSAAGLAVLVLYRDRLVVEADDPGVGESDTEGTDGREPRGSPPRRPHVRFRPGGTREGSKTRGAALDPRRAQPLEPTRR
jgi:hypothetical protein